MIIKKGKNNSTFFGKELFKNAKIFFSKLEWNKILKFILIFSIICTCLYVFMQFTLFITVDSSKYYTYLDYFRGEKSFGEWDTVRGFSFPLIIFLVTSIFGDNTTGVLIGFFLFYMGLIYFAYKIIKELLYDNELQRNQTKYWIMFIVLFVFNPLIIGYSHTLLTEAITPFFYMLFAYLCLKWNNCSFKKNKKQFIVISIILILISIFVWFIKQPYAPAVWSLIILTSILSGIANKSIRIFTEKFLCFIICIVLTLGAIQGWNLFLVANGKTDIQENSSSSFLSQTLIGYTYHYRELPKEKFCNIDYIENSKISQQDKDKIKKLSQEKEDWCDYLKIYDVIDRKQQLIETEVIIQKSKLINLSESISFMLKSITKHPDLVLNSYIENYLSIINLQKTNINNNHYSSDGVLSSEVTHENAAIGYAVFNPNYKNCWWLWQYDTPLNSELLELSTGMENYESNMDNNRTLSTIMQILQDGSDLTFKILLLFCLPIFIYSLIMIIYYRENKSYFILALLSGASFAHIMFHSMMSAIIDRYAYPVYPLMLVCLIILLMDKSRNNQLQLVQNTKNKKRSDKNETKKNRKEKIRR